VFEIVVQHHFCAAHALRGYEGKCRNTHGHNFRVQVTLAGDRLDSRGLLVDFKDVKAALQDAIEVLDHQNLNDLPDFAEKNPSTENLCLYFFERLTRALGDIPGGERVRLVEVRVAETDHYAAVYRPS
jgi:6-pyruvoyltetrahydropterin/6-carboxytetrahydropterin synthase